MSRQRVLGWLGFVSEGCSGFRDAVSGDWLVQCGLLQWRQQQLGFVVVDRVFWEA